MFKEYLEYAKNAPIDKTPASKFKKGDLVTIEGIPQDVLDKAEKHDDPLLCLVGIKS